MKTHLPANSERNFNATYYSSRSIIIGLAFMLGFFVSFNANAQCDAQMAFAIDQADPFTVNFADSSNHTFNSWYWDFGDGDTSSIQHPSHIFAAAGSYTVSLTASDGSCTNTKDIKLNITGTACAANFDGHTDPNNYLHVYGYDRSFAQYGDVVSWSWDMGDGSVLTNQNVDHIYGASGTYSICLTIETSDQCSNSFCQEVQIAPEQNCNSNFSFEFDTQDFHKVIFQDLSNSNVAINSWHWDFGNDSTSTEQHPNHTYTAEGDYNVCLTIADDNQCSSNWCNNVNVSNNQAGGCNTNFYFVQDSMQFNFYDQSEPNGGIASWYWDFGNGSTSTEQHPTYIYTAEGDYNVCLTITDTTQCTSSWCTWITAGGQQQDGGNCYAAFGWDQDPNDWSKILFNNTSGPGTMGMYQWQFGDGNNAYDYSPTHQYSGQGDYNVCLILDETSNQCQDTVCNNINVYPSGDNCNWEPHFTFTNDPNNPLIYTFTDDSEIEDSLIANRIWNFGDGNSISNQITATHNYTSSGTYNACLTIETIDGCIKNWCLNVSVNDGSCTANFGGGMDTTTQTPNTIQFDNFCTYSGGSSIQYIWDFGDGSATTTEFEPSHSFGNDTYNVCLTIEVDGGSTCAHTACQQLNMGNNDCHTQFYFNQSAGNYQEFNFHDQSNGSTPVVEWNWTFGDGGTSNEQNPVHFYTNDGNYEVCLQTMSEDSCISNFCMNISVQQQDSTPPPPGGCFSNFFFEHDTLDFKKVSFTSQSNSDGGNISSWSWNFGDNQTGSGQNISHEFPAAGTYGVCLTISDDAGCSATHCVDIQIQPLDQMQECYASFTFSNNAATPETVQFYASGSSNLTGGYWNFGDGTTSNEHNPMHTFPGEGFYNVCITVWDSISGCQNQFCQGVQIGDPNNSGTGNNCFADFDFTVADQSVAFEDMSQGNITGWYWHFGNVGSSNNENPTYTFANPGFYNVCLNVMDSVSGCQANICKNVEIADTNNTTCQAEFSFINSSSNPNQFTFANNSNGVYTNAHWNFGDGSYSDMMNPSHVFAAGGFYEVCLTVYDSVSGCQASVCHHLNLGLDSTNVDNNCFAEFSHFINANGTVVFDDQSMGSFTNWHWQFGDGTTSNQQNPNHNYTAAGYYDVCLSVWDSLSGCQGHVCHPVSLEDTTGNSNGTMCNADFDYFTDAAGDVHFNNLSSGNLTNGHWSFGDGTFSNNISPVHHFNNPGTYNVCVSVFDTISGCMDQYCENIMISDTSQGGASVNCMAEFSFFPTGNGYGVVFNNESNGTYTNTHWEFGDGTYSDEIEPTHVFNGPGYYQVCLGIMDTVSGCMGHVCHNIQVGDMSTDTLFTDCEAQFSYYPEPDGSVHFENLSQGGFTNVHWMFGDMTFSDMNNPSHLYATNGSYNVCLMIMDSVTGCQDEFCDVVYSTGGNDSTYASCEASFSFMPLQGSTVMFNNTSIGTYTNTHWSFGNFGSSNQAEPTFTFPGPGVYQVCLGVLDTVSGCMDNICMPITITGGTVDSTIAPMDCFSQFDYFTSANGSITFSEQSQGNITNWHWSFGDGTFSTMQNPTHIYASGNYQVCLKVMDSNTGCISEYCEEVYVTAGNDTTVLCNAAFNAFEENNGLVVFENTSQGTYTEVFWQFSDGATSTDISPEHIFTGAGDQGACLTIMDAVSSCQDQFCDGVFIEPDTSNNEVYCEAQFNMFPVSETAVQFVNTSYGTYTDVFWQFSNGAQSYTGGNTIDFVNPGMHGACLTIMDSVSGCQATFCDDIELFNDTTTYCNAEFTYFPVGTDLMFEPLATGSFTGLSWDFSDGYNSNDEFPTHSFENGYYDVCLTVYDTITGCMDTYCDEVNVFADQVANQNCSADFTYYIEQDTSIVHFMDQSTGGASSWYWSFGDNSAASSAQNPVYTYEEDGYYEVCLTVFTDNGCQETYCQVIAVGDVSNSCFAKFNYFADAVTSTAHYDNVSLGNVDTYEWSFGDGMESFQYEPSHTFVDTGYYASCLVVSSSVTGCEDIYCQDIRVGNAIANPCLFSCVWPGDANNDLEANHYDLLTLGFNYGETGPARDSISNMWIGHYAQDWSSAQWDGVNNKNGDCNGDGDIDEMDIEAIQTNFAYSHPDQPRSSSEELTFEILTPNVTIGEDIEIAVIAGEAAPIDLYGIGFEFSLDPTLFDFSTLSVNYSNSWLGDTALDMITVSHAEASLGQLFIALSRKDHISQSGQGEICRLTIRAIGIDEDGTDVGLTTNGGMDAQGDTIPFSPGNTGNVVINSIYEMEFEKKQIVVYPNPSSGDINFNLPIGNGIFEIKVYDQIGNLVYQGSRDNGGTVNLDLEGLASGLYTLEVVHDKVQYIQRFNMNK